MRQCSSSSRFSIVTAWHHNQEKKAQSTRWLACGKRWQQGGGCYNEGECGLYAVSLQERIQYHLIFVPRHFNGISLSLQLTAQIHSLHVDQEEGKQQSFESFTEHKQAAAWNRKYISHEHWDAHQSTITGSVFWVRRSIIKQYYNTSNLQGHTTHVCCPCKFVIKAMTNNAKGAVVLPRVLKSRGLAAGKWPLAWG